MWLLVGHEHLKQSVNMRPNWQRDHLGDEFRFNYSPIGVEREDAVKWGRLFAAQLQTENDGARENEQERDDLSLLPNIRMVSAEGWMNRIPSGFNTREHHTPE